MQMKMVILILKCIKIILPIYENYYEQVCYLYVENPKIEIVSIQNESEIYTRFNKNQVLRVGFEKNYGKFNTSFYIYFKYRKLL